MVRRRTRAAVVRALGSLRGGKNDQGAAAALFPDAAVRFGDVGDPASIRDVAFQGGVDVVVSCLASRTAGAGTPPHFLPQFDPFFKLQPPNLSEHYVCVPRKVLTLR
jgi:hypothetical protein